MMIYSAYVGKRFYVYLDRGTVKQLTDRFGPFNRVDIHTQEDTVQIIPKNDGEFRVAEAPNAAGAYQIPVNTGKINLKRYGRIKISDYDLLADGLYFKLPEDLPEPKKFFERRKSSKKKVHRKTAEHVVAALDQLPIARERQEVPLDLDNEPQAVVLYQGQQYHFPLSKDELLSLALKRIGQQPNS